MRRRTQSHPKNGERGVTMILVAIAMVSMLAIVALAIDVVTLYSARSETQRAADAGALAAAKMLVDMGVTTDPTATVPTAAQIDAATKAAQSVLGNLSIAARTIQTTDVSLTFPGSGTAAFVVNPKVTVTVQNANLPTFFSRIWNNATLTVRASATAEGFNASNSATVAAGGNAVPIIARGVKPFLIPNCDPNPAHTGAACGGAATFFDRVTGVITNPGPAPTGIIGETFTLISDCTGPGCIPNPPATSGPPPGTLKYYPVQMSLTASACPTSCVGPTTFENNIECSNPTPISCGTTATAPAVNQLLLDDTVLPDGHFGPAQEGVECLIHQNPGSGQDVLNTPLTYPPQIQVGNNHPLAGTVLSTNDFVTTSNSLVTIPVYDQTGVPDRPTGAVGVYVIGFLQVFIQDAFQGGGPQAGQFDVTVVNVSGCGNAASGTPVSGTSAVPVRLIHP